MPDGVTNSIEIKPSQFVKTLQRGGRKYEPTQKQEARPEPKPSAEIVLDRQNLPDKVAWKELNVELAKGEYVEDHTKAPWKLSQAEAENKWEALSNADKKQRIKDVRPAGKLSAETWLKQFARLEPDFKKKPVFIVHSTDKGKMLVFKDGYRYRIEPRWLGLDKDSLKDGQKIRVDLASLSQKKAPKREAAAKAKKEAKAKAPKKQADRIAEIEKDLLSKEEKGRSLEQIVKAPTEAQKNLVAERQRLRAGGATTIIPDLAAEVHGIITKTYKNPARMAKALRRMIKRNLRRGANYVRTLGTSGKKLAEDIDQITFRVTKNTNNDLQDIRDIYKGLSKPKREVLSKLVNKRPTGKVSPAMHKKAAHLRAILDRAMNEASELEMTRRVKGKKIPVGGSGKAYPQAVNEKGQKFLEEAAAEGLGSAAVFAWAQEQVKAGKYESVADAISALQAFQDHRMRGLNTYLESERVELPDDMIEWDGLHVLPMVLEKNWMTVEGVRQWGNDFALAKSRIQDIKNKHGSDDALRAKLFIETAFGIRSIASQQAQEISRQLRGFQFISKVGLSPLTIMRNMFDRIAKGFTISPLSTIKTFAKYPPFINQFIRASQKHEDWLIRSGAVFGHGSLSEGYEAGSVLTELASAPFSASERGNQVFIAMVQYDKMLRDLAALKGKDKVLGRLTDKLSYIFGFGKKQITHRISAAAGEKALEKALAGEELTQEETEFMLHVAVRDKAFPMVLSTKPLWYDNHPMIKVAAQFKTWPVSQANMIWRDVVKYTAKTGDPTRLIYFLMGTLIAGELYNILRDFLFDKKESVLSQYRKDPKERELALAILNDLFDGGMVGVFADFAFGIKDWVTGVSVRTGKNVVRTGVEIYKKPRLTAHALELLVEKEITPYRQVKRLAQRVDRKMFNQGNISKQYYDWRAEGWKWRHRKENPSAADKVEAYADRVIMGPVDYKVGENTLALELAARQVIVGDVRDAAKYLRIIIRDEDNLKKALQGIRQSKSNRSPLGKVAQKDRAKFFEGYTAKRKAEALEVQRKYNSMYEQAITLARESK
jgi:hypothetical protein